MDELLSFLLDEKPRLQCTEDNMTVFSGPVRRFYGKRPISIPSQPTFTIERLRVEDHSLVEDMTRLSLARMRGLMHEKRVSRYERAHKKK